MRCNVMIGSSVYAWTINACGCVLVYPTGCLMLNVVLHRYTCDPMNELQKTAQHKALQYPCPTAITVPLDEEQEEQGGF